MLLNLYYKALRRQEADAKAKLFLILIIIKELRPMQGYTTAMYSYIWDKKNKNKKLRMNLRFRLAIIK